MLDGPKNKLKELNEILQLRPILSRGELVADEWWRNGSHNGDEPESFMRRYGVFIFCFVLPVLTSIVYFGFIASSQFVSEARFMVRTSSSAEAGNIAAFMQDQRISRASDETFAVKEYLTSRDAMQHVLEGGRLRSYLANPSADFWTRFPNFHSTK